MTVIDRSSLPEMEFRRAVTQATLERYRDRPFHWGAVDCAKMCAFHLKQFGFKISISRAGSYRSGFGARRAIERMGHPSLPALIDSLGLTRIPYSRLRLGDIITADGHGGIDAIGLYAGNGHIYGFHEDHLDQGLVTVNVTPSIAWSVI